MTRTVPKELVAATSRPLLLAILARGENYGYALLKDVERLSEGAFEWQEGMLYPVLHRLERDGLIAATWRSAEGRRRRYYALTERGRHALAAERRAWEQANGALVRAWGGAT